MCKRTSDLRRRLQLILEKEFMSGVPAASIARVLEGLRSQYSGIVDEDDGIDENLDTCSDDLVLERVNGQGRRRSVYNGIMRQSRKENYSRQQQPDADELRNLGVFIPEEEETEFDDLIQE